MKILLVMTLLLMGYNDVGRAAFGANASSKHCEARTYTLATGNESGFYFAFGNAISNAAAMDGLNIQVLPSKGSVENLKRLAEGRIDFCLAQSDTAYECFHGTAKYNQPATNLIAIASIYTETVHILVRNRLNVKRIQDFSGKRVALGPDGSGTEVIARRLLDAAGISISEIQPIHMEFAASLRALSKDELDVVFVMSGFPSEVMESTLKGGDAWLFEPNIDVCERLVSECTYFVMTTIPRLTYSGQYEDISTIGIRALLLGRSDVDERSAYAMAKAVDVCHRKKSWNYKVPKADGDRGMSTVIPLSRGAVRYYKESGIIRQLATKKYVNYGIAFFIVIGLVWGCIRFKAIRRWARGDGAATGLAACSLFAVWTIGSFVLFYAEHKINDNYGTVFLSFWSSLINWFNFGTKEPYTLIGRVTSTVMMGLGAGGIFWFARNVWKGFKRMNNKNSGHYVIINWNSKGPWLLEQLNNDDLKGEKRNVVVILGLSQHEGSSFVDGEGTTYIKENGVTQKAMELACVKDAHSIIILADETGEPDAADAKTILSILAVRKLQNKDGEPVPIVVEIRDPQKVTLANYVGVLENGSVEVVSSAHLGANLLCQAAVTPGVSRIYSDLLSFADKTNEIYGREIPSGMVGRSFTDFCRHAVEKRGQKTPVIPVGIKRGDNIHLNPTDSEIGVFRSGDSLFAICDNAKALEHLMKEAVHVT